MKTRVSKRIIVILISLAILVNVCLLVFTGNKKDIGAIKTFDCDVKIISLNTNISVSSDNQEVFTISGNVFKIVTDPLKLYDTTGKKIASAGDEYHLISQDSHFIVTDTEKIEMVGNFNLLGDSYDIYVDGEKVAHAKFNFLNTYGTLTDADGNLMADYTSRMYFKDYSVQVTEHNFFSDEALNLIFASYFSDQEADSRSSSHSSNSDD